MAGIYSLRKVMPPLIMRRRRRCFLGFSQKRAFGAAALPSVQYDYDYKEEEGSRTMMMHPPPPLPMEDCEGCFSRRGVQWVFIGSPGSKKHLYAERLSKLLQVPHISMATLVRQELNPRSSLYTQIADAVNLGKVVPEDITFGLLSKRLEEGFSRGETGFILDGIPRTQLQAEILDEIADIDVVVNFKCAEQCLVSKHLITRICSHAELASSDTEDVRKEKLWVYAEQRKALEDYYKKQKKLLDLPVAGGPGETWQGLLAALHLKHMNAIHSSHLVT